MHLNYYFAAGQRCLHVSLKKNISFSSRFMALKRLLDCAASAFSFQTRVEVSQSLKMLSHKEEMLVVLLPLFHCLLSGTPPDWSERQWSCLFGVTDKDRQIEISEGLKREDKSTKRPSLQQARLCLLWRF